MLSKEEQNSLPGPTIIAPPCWCRSPWKSKAGLVMALQMLFSCPIKMPDFTWGLGWAEHTNVCIFLTQEYSGSKAIFFNSITRVCKNFLSLHPKLSIYASLWVHIYFIRITRQTAERLYDNESYISAMGTCEAQ